MSLFGITWGWYIVGGFFVGYWYRGIEDRARSQTKAMRSKVLRMRRALERKESATITTPPKFRNIALEEGDADFASTGCVLTDKIFEAARGAGINPYEEIGPAPTERQRLRSVYRKAREDHAKSATT